MMNYIKASNSETREQKCRLESLVSIFIFNFYMQFALESRLEPSIRLKSSWQSHHKFCDDW